MVVVVVVVVLFLVCGLVACVGCCCCILPLLFCCGSSICFLSMPSVLQSLPRISFRISFRICSCSTAFASVLCAMPPAFLFLRRALLTVSNQLQSQNDLSSFVMCLLCSSLFVFCLYAALNVASSSRCVKCGSSCVYLRSTMNVAESLY